MTKVTTQASLRFAQQMACKQLEMDCSDYDFLFTIRSLPGIVGGPSAGGAAALLAASLLLNKTIPADIAMTGTINSGGTIGPVGGLKQKIEAAAGNHVRLVLLPKGTKDWKESNKTVDLIQYGKDLNLTVQEVSTLGEVLELALDIPQVISNEPLQIEGRYQRIMSEVSEDLCRRSAEYFSKPLKENLTQAKNFTERAAVDQQRGAYYAAASYCFRANVEYKSQWYLDKNFTKEELEKKIAALRAEADKFQKDIEARNITTLTDLQTFMAVMERIDEAKDLVSEVEDDLKNNNTGSAPKVGFAEERLFSGITWARFFNGQDKLVVIDKASLQSVCIEKISEAEERYNYVIDLKLQIARQALIKAQRKNVFPIIAYSYHEYAKSLKDFDRVSSMLFTEYSLELSNLDIYFEEKKPAAGKLGIPKLPSTFFAFVIGVVAGA